MFTAGPRRSEPHSLQDHPQRTHGGGERPHHQVLYLQCGNKVRFSSTTSSHTHSHAHSAAVNVLLEDSSFPEEHFVIEQGLLTTTWDRIQSYPHFLSLSLPPISMSYLPVCLSTCCVHVAGDVHKFSRV